MALDKIKGMFIAGFLGDALGAPHEFYSNQNTVYTGKLEHAPFFTSRFGHTNRLNVAQITDDSEMTLALLRTLINDKQYIRDNVIMSYMKWASSGFKFMGKNTRALFKCAKLDTYNKRMQKAMESEISQSNGFLMRASPLALLSDNTIMATDAYVSNPSSICTDTNNVYVLMLKCALNNMPRNDIFNYVRSFAQTNEVKQIFTDVENRIPRDISHLKGWCLHALWVTLIVLTSNLNYPDAMRWIIAGNKGSDTDTNASICGYLLGILFGYEALCSDPQTLENINLLYSVNNKYIYGISDFDQLMDSAYKLYLLQNNV